MKYHPQFGDLTIEPKPQPKAKVVHGALLNPPTPGTKIRATLQGLVVEGKVTYIMAEYGAFTVEREVWIDRHYRGLVTFNIELKLGWDIEILEEATA